MSIYINIYIHPTVNWVMMRMFFKISNNTGDELIIMRTNIVFKSIIIQVVYYITIGNDNCVGYDFTEN